MIATEPQTPVGCASAHAPATSNQQLTTLNARIAWTNRLLSRLKTERQRLLERLAAKRAEQLADSGTDSLLDDINQQPATSNQQQRQITPAEHAAMDAVNQCETDA